MANKETGKSIDARFAALQKQAVMAQKIDKSKLHRVLITTDLEVDDMNGVLLTLLYADQFDLAGIVWTAGMFHFSGDGEHTLGEITPHYRCGATTAEGTVENAGQLKCYRPADPGWLRRTIDVDYRADYEYLSQNSPNYPTPDELLAITKTGNIAFEGDYRFPTEGSELIKNCILDDDPRPLIIQHWGGINTTVRALLSIYEEYKDTAEWPAIRRKVVDKVRLEGTGEDYCKADSGIDDIFPGLQEWPRGGYVGYGNYFRAIPAESKSPAPEGAPSMMMRMGTSARLNPYYRAPYLTKNIKYGHGQLMAQFRLVNDGQVTYGEPDVFQFGLKNTIDWGKSAELGYDGVPGFASVSADTNDWLCSQFETAEFINIGLRREVKNRDDRFTIALFDEWAARAEWAVKSTEACNHPPVLTAGALDVTAAPGETVSLCVSVFDPDGDDVDVCWLMLDEANTYAGGSVDVSEHEGLATSFTVPADAKSGDSFVVTAEARDAAEKPMTRYAQIIVTVA